MTRSRILLLVAASVGFGIVVGGNLFSRTQPRSFIALKRCENCLSVADLAGLLGSVAIQKFPGFVPAKVVETDKTVAIRLPPDPGLHYVIIPKKDLKDVGDISEADAAYLVDAYQVARHLIEKHRLSAYRFYTNGPGLQNVTYLHFHLVEVRDSTGR